MTAKDVDPKYNGIGFTEGCKGCQAIVNGKPPVAHSQECRLRLMEQAPNNEKIAARVKRSLGKTGEFLAKNVERGEEKRKREVKHSSLPRKEKVAQEPPEPRSEALHLRQLLRQRFPRRPPGRGERRTNSILVGMPVPQWPPAYRPEGPGPRSPISRVLFRRVPFNRVLPRGLRMANCKAVGGQEKRRDRRAKRIRQDGSYVVEEIEDSSI